MENRERSEWMASDDFMNLPFEQRVGAWQQYYAEKLRGGAGERLDLRSEYLQADREARLATFRPVDDVESSTF